MILSVKKFPRGFSTEESLPGIFIFICLIEIASEIVSAKRKMSLDEKMVVIKVLDKRLNQVDVCKQLLKYLE